MSPMSRAAQRAYSDVGPFRIRWASTGLTSRQGRAEVSANWWEFGEDGGYNGANPWQSSCADSVSSVARGRSWRNFIAPSRTAPSTCTSILRNAPVAGITWLPLGPTPNTTSTFTQVRGYPYPRGSKLTPSKNWPPQVGLYWTQAHDNIARENYEMAIVAARTALQCAARNDYTHPAPEQLRAEAKEAKDALT